MPSLHVLRVFTDANGSYGNPLGVFTDASQISEPARQPIAAELGFSETVFVDDPDQGKLRLYTPAAELPFAGHALIGTAWLLRRERGPITQLVCPAGTVPVWHEGDLFWLRGQTSWCPAWRHLRASSAEQVAAAKEAPAGYDAVQVWAFEDEPTGGLRARVFAPRFGVTEDEACGSASMLLAAKLQRRLTIHHGNGSEIFVQPGDDETVDLGGRVKLAELRTFPT